MDFGCQFPRDLDPDGGGTAPVLRWHLSACPDCREEIVDVRDV